MIDLSIVIVNYNTCDKLRDCLESILRHQQNLTLEILVVDNGSRDGSRDMIREYAPAVTLIAPDTNTWFTGGNNIGIKTATGELVWILNPDTIVQANTMQIMVDYLRNHSDVGVLTSQMRFPDGSDQPTCSMTPKYLDLLLGYTFLGVIFSGLRDKRRSIMFYEDWERDTAKQIEVAPGSNMMCPRDVVLDIGLMDEDLQLYFPEDDLCRRLIDAGKKIQFIPEPLLLHHEHASVEQVQRLASSIYFRDLLVFCGKHYGLLARLLLGLLLIPTRWGMNLAQRLRGEKVTLS